MVAGALFVGFVRFSLEVHAFHGVDYWFFDPCLSQRRVGCSFALRVSPAVTRLTVYHRPQVGNDRANIFVPNGVFKLELLRLHKSDRHYILREPCSGII